MLTPLKLTAAIWLVVMPLSGAVMPASGRLSASNRANGSGSSERETPIELLAMSDEELASRIQADPSVLGSLSIGTAGSSILYNAVALPADPRWQLARGAQSWTTTETIESLMTAVGTVNELFEETPPVTIGDISAANGGRLKRHESHQGGRDVDIGFYYKTGNATRFTQGTAANLDLPRNWVLVRSFLTRTDVERIFLDTRIQRLLYKHALGIGEEKEWLDQVFQFSKGSRSAIVQHRTHYHVRFYNPVAQELGRRAHPFLVQMNLIAPPVFTVRHVVKRGQTLGSLAARYGTSARAIMRANGLRSARLRAGRAYRIPVRAAVPSSQPIVIPPRMLPSQTPEAIRAVAWPTTESRSVPFKSSPPAAGR